MGKVAICRKYRLATATLALPEQACQLLRLFAAENRVPILNL